MCGRVSASFCMLGHTSISLLTDDVVGSSNVCRVSALGFGFERAFGFDDGGDHYDGTPNKARARWVDVDVEARVVPAWHAFELH